MDLPDTFLVNAGTAALLGTLIGLERQWGQHPAGLRTNALVSLGAALFVSVAHLLPGLNPGPAHVAGQIVTGVGFLGGGVILREGLNIRGLNTAATLWCTAAVGALAGAGHPLAAAVGTAGVLVLNLVLRPINALMERRLRRAEGVQTLYRLRVACRAGQEGAVRAVVLRFFHDHPSLAIQSLATQEGGDPGRACVVADIHSERRDDRAMEDLMGLVNDEPSVSSVSWEKTGTV